MKRTTVFFAFIVLLVITLPCYAGQAQKHGYNDLVSIAKAKGAIPVIVRLNMPFQALGKLKSSQAVQAQVDSIAQSQSTLLNSLAGLNVTNIKHYSYIPVIAMQVDEASLAVLSSYPLVAEITEDVAVPPALLESVPLTGATTAWAEGYNGAGQIVAILDTGIDKTHPMLDNGKVVAEACYSSTYVAESSTTVCPNGKSSQTGPGAARYCSIEGCDHGTHVAGIAAGNDINRNGVAKDANIIAVQVFSKFNSYSVCNSSASCLRSYISDLLSALEYIYTLRNTYNIAAVNMSLGSERYYSNCDTETLKPAIDNLRSAGIATVIASGNGYYKDGISSPACISTAVSVGATNDLNDTVDSYSNSASFLSLLAPGSEIVSSVPGGGTGSKKGTSMATPHVTGAWAILKQKLPSATVGTILSVLQSTGIPITDSNDIAKPRINVNAAVGALGISIAEAADNTTLIWTTGGNANWIGQATVSYFGNDAVKNGFVGHNQSSWLQTTVTGPGTLTFHWKVSSEVNNDFLSFYIDGVEQSGKISGDIDWHQKSYNLTSGNHTLKWSYSKNGSVNSGSDTGWLDKVEFTTGYFPDIDFSPASVSFGSLNTGTSLSQTLTIRNNGVVDLVIGSITGPAEPFSILTDNCSGQTLAPSASCTLSVRFAPDITGSFSDTFDISSNDPDENPITVSLSGTGGVRVDEDFETGGLSKFTWVTGVDGLWRAQNVIKHNGNYAAAPVSIGDSQSSYLEVTLNITSPGDISFWYKVSSEADFDYLRFKIDGVQQGNWAGELDWDNVNYAVSAGQHTFRWEYTKDSSISTGSDTVWIDDIIFPLTDRIPDLVVKSVSKPPASKKLGSSFSVKARIKNKGVGAADKEFTLGYYLSKNRDKRINKETDILLTDDIILLSLLAGASSKETIQINIPLDTPVGKYYVKVCADNRLDVTESNEENNCRASVRKIKVK